MKKRGQGIAQTIAKFCNAAMENSGRKAVALNLFRGSLSTLAFRKLKVSLM